MTANDSMCIEEFAQNHYTHMKKTLHCDDTYFFVLHVVFVTKL